MARSKTNTQNSTKHAEHEDAADILNKLFFVYFAFFYFLWFLKWYLQEMLSYRLGTVNDFHWGFKPLLTYSKTHTYSTFIGEEKENICIYSLYPDHLEYEQNDRKVKISIFKMKVVIKRMIWIMNRMIGKWK